MNNTLGTIERCEACCEAADNGILWESLPVPVFGNPRSTRVKVATIAVNPAGGEFLVGANAKTREERLPLLRDYHKRQRRDLGSSDILDAQERRDSCFCIAQGIPRNCCHPWFDPLELILRGMNPDWSYFKCTVVHIDLVACATERAWRSVPEQAKKTLQHNCRGHVRRTLSELPRGTLLLSNGVEPKDIPVEIDFELEILNALPRLKIWRGTVLLDSRLFPFLGWSVTAKNMKDDQKASLWAVVRQYPFHPAHHTEPRYQTNDRYKKSAEIIK